MPTFAQLFHSAIHFQLDTVQVLCLMVRLRLFLVLPIQFFFSILSRCLSPRPCHLIGRRIIRAETFCFGTTLTFFNFSPFSSPYWMRLLADKSSESWVDMKKKRGIICFVTFRAWVMAKDEGTVRGTPSFGRYEGLRESGIKLNYWMIYMAVIRFTWMICISFSKLIRTISHGETLFNGSKQLNFVNNNTIECFFCARIKKLG